MRQSNARYGAYARWAPAPYVFMDDSPMKTDFHGFLLDCAFRGRLLDGTLQKRDLSSFWRCRILYAMSFTSRKSVRVLSILLVLTVAFSLLLLLPPVQGLFISAGERLKGRELNGGHWRTALSSLSLCVILFSAIAGALFSAAVKFSGIAGLAAAVNGSRVKGRYIAVAFFLLTLLAAGA